MAILQFRYVRQSVSQLVSHDDQRIWKAHKAQRRCNNSSKLWVKIVVGFNTQSTWRPLNSSLRCEVT